MWMRTQNVLAGSSPAGSGGHWEKFPTVILGVIVELACCAFASAIASRTHFRAARGPALEWPEAAAADRGESGWASTCADTCGTPSMTVAAAAARARTRGALVMCIPCPPV